VKPPGLVCLDLGASTGGGAEAEGVERGLELVAAPADKAHAAQRRDANRGGAVDHGARLVDSRAVRRGLAGADDALGFFAAFGQAELHQQRVDADFFHGRGRIFWSSRRLWAKKEADAGRAGNDTKQTGAAIKNSPPRRASDPCR